MTATTGPAAPAEPLLSVRDLHVGFPTRDGVVHAVRGFDLDVAPGEVVGVVGESGSGKTTAMLALTGLLDDGATVSGSVRFDGREIIGQRSLLRQLRGGRIGTIFQDPMTSLNPVLPVGRQIAEAVLAHQRIGARAATRRAVELLELVSIPDAPRRAKSHPHELSGGMRQRVMIAMSLANDPDLLVADEPTTALDVTIQAQILGILAGIRAERRLAIVLITHDLGVVAGLADRVTVMYAGRVVESNDVFGLFERPRHPYTRGLLRCLPRLDRPRRELTPIGGAPPAMIALASGCAFAPRCAHADERCAAEDPALLSSAHGLLACHHSPAEEAGR
jgi:oligopeptide/dipeptide ABC transporter ATP-binding protein